MRRAAYVLAVCAALGSPEAGAAQTDFPFDSELILDAAPMRGSKRIPNMDVGPNGAIALEMWCHRAEGQFMVTGDAVAVTFNGGTPRDCPPERVAADRDLMTALSEVTHWRRSGDTLTLIGPRTLRFRLPTN